MVCYLSTQMYKGIYSFRCNFISSQGFIKFSCRMRIRSTITLIRLHSSVPLQNDERKQERMKKVVNESQLVHSFLAENIERRLMMNFASFYVS